MPNREYLSLLEFIMPSWDSKDIDIEFRLAGILGMQGTGKTTLAMTLANDLSRKYGDEFITLKGFWLHKLLPAAAEAGVLEGKKYALIILEDATAVLHTSQSAALLSRDMAYFWRLRHILRDAGLKEYTAKIALIINMHSYMTINKYLRNAHVLIIKSLSPKWQRWEHEDITLKWLYNTIAKELTRMRFSGNPEEVTAALSKALVAYHTGYSTLIKYEARKEWPPQFYENNDIGVKEEEKKSEEPEDMHAQLNALARALQIMLEEFNVKTKVDKKKYLLVRKNGHWKSLGPVAPLVKGR